MATGYWSRARKIAAVLVVVLVLSATLAIGALSGWFGLVRPGPPPATVNATLVIGTTAGYPNSGFWGVNAESPNLENPALAALVNHTPLAFFRFGPNGEGTNQPAGVTYSPNGTPSPVLSVSDAAFVTWCRWVRCHAIMMVPAEIDNTSMAVATVQYVERTLGFHPDLWSIGNEPEVWTHYNIPWVDWRYTDNSRATPMEYALEVHRYVAALRAVDPTIHIVGIQASTAQPAELHWLTDVVGVEGPNLTAVAYHAYPGGYGTPSGSLSDFFTSLTDPTGFPMNYPGALAAVRAACLTCNLPVLVDEYNAASPGSTFGPYVSAYPEVPYIGAGIIESLRENVTQVAYFFLQASETTSQFGMLGPALDTRPVYQLYSVFFQNLSTGRVVNTTLVGAPPGAFSVLTQNGTRTSLFVVDTNLNTGIRLNLTASGFPLTGAWTYWSWDPNSASPQERTMTPSLSVHLLAPAEGILLLTATAP